MPMRAPSIRGCCGRRLPTGVLCPCQAMRKAQHDAARPSAAARGYDNKWRTESKGWLAQPENERCACGCGRKADMVDHIVPHRGDRKLFWGRSNWQALVSSPCHTRRKQSLEARGVVGDFQQTDRDRRTPFAQEMTGLGFPEMAVVSLDEIKAQLRIDHADDDAALTQKVDAAQAHLERLLGFKLDDVTYPDTDEVDFPETVPAPLRECVLQLAAYWFDGSPDPAPTGGIDDVVREFRNWSWAS